MTSEKTAITELSSRRIEYLQQFWSKYPECPRGFLQYGRIQNMRLGITQVAGLKVCKNQLSDPDFKASEILIDGDLIALMPAGQFILLAPNLTTRLGKALTSNESDRWHLKKSYFDYLTLIRHFFLQKRFQEVTTPILVKCPGTEPSLDVFETHLDLGLQSEKLFLATSPELHLKKLLVHGFERIFEIAHVFRNNEKTSTHHHEFLMLEWYRSMSNLSQIKHDAIELIEHLCEQLKTEKPKEVLTYTVADLFKTYCDFDLKPDTNYKDLESLALKLNIDIQSATSIDDLFILIFIEKIEFQWPQDRLVFVEKYPNYQAALARLDKNGWAERFEIYWKGFELANAFHELNDPEEQRLRSKEDLIKKKSLGKKNVTLDEDFFHSLDYGLPPSSGIALGLARLFMALKNVKNIDDLVDFST